MKSEMESQQEQNNPTSEEVTTRSLNADGNKVEKNRTTEEEVNSPIVNTDTNESKQEDETEYYDFDTLDDIEVELPQGKIRRFPPTSKVEPKDPFQAMW